MKIRGQREIQIEGLLRRIIEAVRTVNTELLRAPEHRSDGVISTAISEQNAVITEAIELGVVR